MAGLVGEWTRAAHAVDLAALDTAARSMLHSPELRVELDSGARWGAGRVHLPFMNPGSQPERAGERRLFFDGEIHNLDDLRSRYRVSGGRATVGSAPAVVLALYDRAGWDFVRHATGIFALALVDEADDTVTLVNDRYGLRRLYFRAHDEGLAWAGELKAFAHFAGFQPELDPLAVREWFGVGHLLADRSWFRSVRLLSPASILTASRQGVEHRRYWSWEDAPAEEDGLPESDLLERIHRAWRPAVRSRIDDMRLGQGLSGGLDSRAILAEVPDDLPRYHVVTFGREGSREVRIAREAARRKGFPHHLVDVHRTDLISDRAGPVWRSDGMVSLLHLHGGDFAADAYDIQLNGFLGDATLGGGYICQGDTDDFLLRTMSTGSPLGMPTDDLLDHLHHVWQGRGAPEQFLFDQRGRRFIYAALTARQHSIEFRLPFVDPHFLDLVWSIPARRRADSAIYGKFLLNAYPALFADLPWAKTGLPIGASGARRARHRLAAIPAHVFRGLKRRLRVGAPSDAGGFAHYAAWIRAPSEQAILRATLLEGDPLCFEHLDPDAARRSVRALLAGDDAHLSTVGLLLTLELFLRQLHDPASRVGGSAGSPV